MTPDATMLSRRYADLLRANGCSDRTIDNYLYDLKGFTRFRGERPLSEATADDIIAYQVDVAARGLSDSSVRVAPTRCPPPWWATEDMLTIVPRRHPNPRHGI